MPKFIKTISEYHRYRGLTQPYHPMISVVDYNDIRSLPEEDFDRLILDFYAVSLKRTKNAKIIYGQQQCDFDSGVLFFMAPRQVSRSSPSEIPNPNTRDGCYLFIRIFYGIHIWLLLSESMTFLSTKSMKHYFYPTAKRVF
ncbi:hypothetical protein [Sphingobacterium thalpophilum]|uniref:hypothetical protein n=1 Tax=Sphingobacterium thalpophilum TaxID=259 RepID=UPI0031F48765